MVAQGPPTSQLGGDFEGSCVIRRNDGQLKDTDHNPVPDIIGSFENAPLGVYLKKYTQVSLTYAKQSQDSVPITTDYRVDMTVRGAKRRTPVLSVPAEGEANFYLGGVTAEHVPAFYSAKYPSVRDSLDMYINGSTTGPRLVLALRPGGNANNLKLQFVGQDSLGINWQGGLMMFIRDYWVELKQGLAYQVETDGTIIPISWTPTYNHQDSSAIIGFDIGTYDHTKTLVLEIGYQSIAQGGGDTRNMEWSTYMGGFPGSTFSSVETDEDGDVYVGGNTWAYNFPVAPGSQEFDPAVPNAPGADNAIIAKFRGDNKRLSWATYYGGTVQTAISSGSNSVCTSAQRIAVYTGPDSNRQFVYATGSTNCNDFPVPALISSVYSNADHQSFQGGIRRMWLGAYDKTHGTCAWATTRGQSNGQTWAADGLSVAVDKVTNQVAVGGRMVHNYLNIPVFPLVTPTGAYTRADGDAFLVLYNADGTVRWSTTFAGHDNYVPYNQITDLDFTNISWDHNQKLWLTGSSSYASNFYLEGVPAPVAGGFYQEPSSQDAVIGSFDLATLQLEYLTAWGGMDELYTGRKNVAMGLDVAGKNLWVVGGTHATDLTNTECPDPNVAGTYHTTTHSGGTWNNRCEGFILAMDPVTFQLKYGTLIGGDQDEMLLDVKHDAYTVYITGETRSNMGIVSDLDPDKYFQPLNANIGSRDALILAVDLNPDAPIMRWRTAFGGTQSDRGWSIAASANSVYVVGATASDWWQDFPLQEFDANDDLDYFQGASYGGSNLWSFLPWYAFEAMLDWEWNYYGEVITENTSQHSEAFIASFASNYHVGITEPESKPGFGIIPLQGTAQWGIQYPFAGNWTLTAYDATGRQVGAWSTTRSGQPINLARQASGIYLLRATEAGGTVLSGKVYRP